MRNAKSNTKARTRIERIKRDRTDTTGEGMKHEALTEKLIGTFYSLYNELGHGFLESIYQRGYGFLLNDEGIAFVEQAPVRVMHRGRDLGEFKIDLLVEDLVLVEVKAVKSLDLAHEKQVFNYLKATNVEVGLLFNFGPRPQVKRIILDNEYKVPRSAAAGSLS
jgi:GxxExxY protein